MSFEVQPAQPADASRLADVFFASFDDEFNRTMFPPAPDTHDWFSNNFFSDAIAQHFTGDGHVTVLKVVEASNPTEIAAFAIWRRYMTSADRDRREESHNSDMQLPASSDKALCEHFFGAMEEEHQKWMGDRPHYYLDILGTHASYQGHGCASKLLHWGLAHADEQGVELFLSASPRGMPLYAKNGFRVVNSNTLDMGYELSSMIRASRKDGESGNSVA